VSINIEDNFRFKAVYNGELWEVKAIDWENKNLIITTHLKRKDSGTAIVEKVYIDEEYADTVIFLRSSGLKDKSHDDIFDRQVIINSDTTEEFLVEYKSGGFYLSSLDDRHSDDIAIKDINTSNFYIVHYDTKLNIKE